MGCAGSSRDDDDQENERNKQTPNINELEEMTEADKKEIHLKKTWLKVVGNHFHIKPKQNKNL